MSLFTVMKSGLAGVLVACSLGMAMAQAQDRVKVSKWDIDAGRWNPLKYDDQTSDPLYRDRLRGTVLVEFPENANGYLFLLIGTTSGERGRIKIYEAVERDGRIEKGLNHPVAAGEKGPYDFSTQEEASRGPGNVLAPVLLCRFNWVKRRKLIIELENADLVIRDLDVSG